MIFSSDHLSRSVRQSKGMTLLESLLAILMLVVFTGVVAMVMQFTLRFFSPAEPEPSNQFGVSHGVLIDHRQLNLLMDDLAGILSQPGISLSGKSYPQSEHPNVACTNNPVRDWDLVMMDEQKVKNLIPPGYRLCIWTTTKLETPSGSGIYMLQALPEKLSSFGLPTRRLFCRPRPRC